MGRKTTKKAVRYSADFETLTKAPTRVWLWGLIDIEDPELNGLLWGTDMDSFVKFISSHNNVCEFFNLKFDGMFLLYWLLTNGYEHVETGVGSRGLARGEFTSLISNDGKFYTMKVKWPTGFTTEFVDAAKKFPGMSVARLAQAYKLEMSKGDIDYHAERPIGYEPTAEELDYLDRDVRIVAKALRIIYDQGMTRLTAGSNALAEYKQLIEGENMFRGRFPILSETVDAEIRLAYRGGFTYVAERFRGKRLGAGMVFDVNSLYPSVMYNELIPYGMPEWFEGKQDPTDKRPLTIFSVTFTAKLKRRHIPCIQIKGTSIFGDTEYLKAIEEPTTLWVTNVDWQLYQDHYDIEVLSFNGGYAFKAVKGLFKDFIDKWSKIKAEATGGLREIAKLQLNSLYGKFASNPDVTGKVPYLSDKGTVKFTGGTEQSKDPVYTAAGVFITSFARDLTIRAAQRNYDTFAYADTDSLHLLQTRAPDDLDVHGSRMGAWKLEYEFVEAHFVRPKRYLEKLEDGSYKVAFAGLPTDISNKLTFDDLIEGAVIHGKLKPSSVEGGVILEDTTFTLNL